MLVKLRAIYENSQHLQISNHLPMPAEDTVSSDSELFHFKKVYFTKYISQN